MRFLSIVIRNRFVKETAGQSIYSVDGFLWEKLIETHLLPQQVLILARATNLFYCLPGLRLKFYSLPLSLSFCVETNNESKKITLIIALSESVEWRNLVRVRHPFTPLCEFYFRLTWLAPIHRQAEFNNLNETFWWNMEGIPTKVASVRERKLFQILQMNVNHSAVIAVVKIYSTTRQAGSFQRTLINIDFSVCFADCWL